MALIITPLVAPALVEALPIARPLAIATPPLIMPPVGLVATSVVTPPLDVATPPLAARPELTLL